MSLPRGRCPQCGKDSALTPSGKVWRHLVPSEMVALGLVAHTSRQYSLGTQYEHDCKGSSAKPMTAEQCERWDELVRVKRDEHRAEWKQREQQREEAEFAEFMRQRWAFRRFDEQAFAACPWRSQCVAFIAVADDGAVTYACQVQPKRAMLGSQHRILVAWPGRWSQDIFLLSDQDKAAALTML